jgi:hypothetical protein
MPSSQKAERAAKRDLEKRKAEQPEVQDKPCQDDTAVDEAVDESFPASDPPSFTPEKTGT